MTDNNLRHKLAAILAADAAGYSRLAAGDDRAAVAALDAARAVFRTRRAALKATVDSPAIPHFLSFATGSCLAAHLVHVCLAGDRDDVRGDCHNGRPRMARTATKVRSQAVKSCGDSDLN